MLKAQVLILGTGIAGLSAALKFARQKTNVLLIAKADIAEGSTRYAQGGIASVWSKKDSFKAHVQDTLVAGAGLCNREIVKLVVQEGPAAVRELIELGVKFTKNSSKSFDLHREGGHGQRRILHADDLTGWAIEKALVEQVKRNRYIKVLEHHVGIDLITEGKIHKKLQGHTPLPGRCLGAYVLNTKTGKVLTLASNATVLATGGAGKVYLYTTNPDTASGDGMAMAFRAGARVANLEFFQFHPTCLFHPSARTLLISEALRGEGAVLKNLAGEPFMDRHHAMASLAPRDIVARAIDLEMKRTGDKHVHLDARHLGAEKLRKHFPNIYSSCLALGIDITQVPIPVVPAAHYTCGGVLTDEHGKTNVEGLYAIGEVACTGLHGANRLASNSLLEAVVFAERVYQHLRPLLKNSRRKHRSSSYLAGKIPQWDTGHAVALEEQIDIAANWHEIRLLMWNFVGIVRSTRRLSSARRRLDLIQNEVNAYYWNYLPSKDLVELRNLITVASLIVQSAQTRKESRGLHYTVDYPARDDQNFGRDTVM